MIILFYLAAAVALISTTAVIFLSNVVHALIYLILSLLSVAVIFFVLGAPFAAVLEAIVYAGAIMVLFLFVIMMLNMGPTTEQQEKQWLSGKIWIIPVILAAVLLVQLVVVLLGNPHEIVPVEVGVKQISISLFGPYLLAVELASMLLLGGLISAYHLAKK